MGKLLERAAAAAGDQGLTAWAAMSEGHVGHIGTVSERSRLGSSNWAWGCGYRNLQMLFSAMLARPSFHARLASHPLLSTTPTASSSSSSSSSHTILSILQWQLIIQDAWRTGFDPDGAAHFAGKLVGKKQWIGTTEVYVALSRLGIRCQIVDFPGPSGPNGQHTKLIQWVENYFQSASSSQADHHKGHSRTIIGVERTRQGETLLLVLDPANVGPATQAGAHYPPCRGAVVFPFLTAVSQPAARSTPHIPPASSSGDAEAQEKRRNKAALAEEIAGFKPSYCHKLILYVLDQLPESPSPQNQSKLHIIQSLRIV
ncbi:hypothetical protein PCASD_19178 [Puccinia coronata f. sp. avenae]|uniref:UFSP1/2/DUB catalytic domain-containing protein n=1 Tax=Puccinia coronata f. sp. avenae TaxID=200324 RepID=A0A2N5TY83_9BASI|nr:hypothetical protein PCASD_19178 [Puccinia coronata f. sp. avenae]